MNRRYYDLYCTLHSTLTSAHLPVLHSINNTCTDIHLRQLRKLKFVEEKAFPWFCELSIPLFLRYSMHTIYVFLALLAVATRAHMSLWYPPPLGGSLQANPLTTQVDNELNFPIGCCDSDGRPTLPSPGDCRGHLHLLDTVEGRPQVTWELPPPTGERSPGLPLQGSSEHAKRAGCLCLGLAESRARVFHELCLSSDRRRL
jgi:hypothetical protein